MNFTIISEDGALHFPSLGTVHLNHQPMVTLVRFEQAPTPHVIDVAKRCIPTRLRFVWHRVGIVFVPILGARPSAKIYRSEVDNRLLVIQYDRNESPNVREACERALRAMLSSL